MLGFRKPKEDAGATGLKLVSAGVLPCLLVRRGLLSNQSLKIPSAEDSLYWDSRF